MKNKRSSSDSNWFWCRYFTRLFLVFLVGLSRKACIYDGSDQSEELFHVWGAKKKKKKNFFLLKIKNKIIILKRKRKSTFHKVQDLKNDVQALSAPLTVELPGPFFQTESWTIDSKGLFSSSISYNLSTYMTSLNLLR